MRTETEIAHLQTATFQPEAQRARAQKFGPLVLATAISTALGCLSTAVAQTGDQMEEIVVTAQKREERLNDIPASISAYSADSLAAKGVTNTKELELLTPGLVFTTFNGAAHPYVRGIGSENAQIATESPFALYIDGVYRPALYSGIQNLAYIERAEILLGPQGTLYGRNSTAGAMNVITRDPISDPLVEGSLSYGNKGFYEASGYVTGGSDTLAANVAVTVRSHEGFQLNHLNNQKIDDEKLQTARGKIRYTPNDRFTATLAFDVTRQDDTAASAFSYLDTGDGTLARPLPILLGGNASTDPRETYVDPALTYKNVDDKGFGLTLRYEMGSFDLVSITGGSESQVLSAVDQDSSDLKINGSFADQVQDTLSQEFQIVSNGDDRWRWLLGAYWYHSDAGFDELHIQPEIGPSVVDITGHVKTDAYAAFGQLSYSFTDRLSATLGLRYSSEEKQRKNSTLYIAPIDTLITEPTDPSKRWSDTTPDVTLRYDTGANMLYAKYSEGFRSGNYNAVEPGGQPVDPETIEAFEVGGKHSLGAGVQLNWAAYHYDYKDLQVSVVTESQQVILENASSAKLYGADLSIDAIFGGGWSARMAGGYLHGRYKDYQNASLFIADPTNGGYGHVGISGDASDNDTVRSPDFTVSAGLNYDATVSIGELHLSGTWYYNDGFYFNVANDIAQDSYSIFNARAELEFSSNISLLVFANNIGDKDIISGVVQGASGDLAMYSAPRLYGAGVKFKY